MSVIRRFWPGFLALAVLFNWVGHRPSLHGSAQTQISVNPQSRIAATNIGRGYVVSSSLPTAAPCSAYTSVEACVAPSTGTSTVAGVAAEDCTAGTRCQVQMNGLVDCLFDNTPVIGQLAYHNGYFCDSQPNSILNSLVGVGIVGYIYALDANDPTRAWLVQYRPGATGEILPPAYLYAASGVPSVTTFYRGDGAWATPPNSGGTVTSWSWGTLPSWLTGSVATATTTPAASLTASAIPNTALANSSITVNTVSCVLGSSCTVYPPAIGTATVSGNAAISLIPNSQQINVAVSGVVVGGNYAVIMTGAPTSGFSIMSSGYCTTAGTLVVTMYSPAVSVLTAYSIPIKVFRIG